MKWFAVPVTLYIQAVDEKHAAAFADLECLGATTRARAANSGYITDKTAFQVSGKVVQTTACALPKSPCRKSVLARALGEQRAIRMTQLYTHLR